MYIVDSFKKCSREFKQKLLDIDPTTDPVLLFAKQGRTPGTFSVAFKRSYLYQKGLKIWDWRALAASNSQLFDFDSTKFPGEKNYKPKVK